MRTAGLARVALAFLLLPLAAAAAGEPPSGGAAGGAPAPPPGRSIQPFDDPEARPGAALPDDLLAGWRSPVGHAFLTEGEYLILHPRRVRHVDLNGDGRPELLALVPFDAGDGSPALSVAVLNRARDGYRSRLLLNCAAEELAGVRVVRLRRGGPPRIVVTERGGSGGFLGVRVFGWSRGQYRLLWGRDGIYQGRFRLLAAGRSGPSRLELTGSVHGEVNAYPAARLRERYAWVGDRFTLTSRRRLAAGETIHLPGHPRPLPRLGYPPPDE